MAHISTKRAARGFVRRNDTPDTRVEFRGEPVVTFAMVDKVHQRPDGTAKRTFSENRERFLAGEDFIEVGRDEIRTMSIFPTRTARATLITRRGYLKLVKPLTDMWRAHGADLSRVISRAE